jgi:hypothetical protein
MHWLNRALIHGRIDVDDATYASYEYINVQSWGLLPERGVRNDVCSSAIYGLGFDKLHQQRKLLAKL